MAICRWRARVAAQRRSGANIAMRDHLVLYVNGIRRKVGARDAVRTLTDFLRDGQTQPGLTGTKVACAGGDCGACTVLASLSSFKWTVGTF